MSIKLNNREFLHSLSRINDRLNQLEKDIKRFKQESSIATKSLCDDSRSIRNAFDSLYKDLTGDKNDKNKKGGEEK